MNELNKKSAGELAALIKEKQVSSTEVVEAHLKRIEEVNPDVNAITLALGETALAAAKKADHASDSERERTFHGVPFTIKENIDLIGTPTTNGIPLMAEAMPPRNAPIVDRMLAAGAIPSGRTNLPELGMRLYTDNHLRGRTFNPWNKNLTPGGSSGGEGAAIATGMSPFGLGNDIGGSLRNPAYCCGIASLKPSIGRLPFVNSIEPVDMGISGAFLTDGPMARSVDDLRNGLKVMSGRHIDDPQSVDAPLTGVIPDKPKAALIREIPGFKLTDATLREIDRAGSILADRGWIVEEKQAPEVPRVYEIWGTVLNNGMMGAIPPEVFKKETARLVSS